MWIEFFEDMLEQNPGKLYQWVGEDSEIQHVTGDPNIDKIEQLNATGDIDGVLAELDRWEAEAEAAKAAEAVRPEPTVAQEAPASYPDKLVDFEDFDDSYGD